MRPGEHFLAAAGRPLSEWPGLFSILFERPDSLLFQLRDVKRSDTGHQAQVIVVVPALVAFLPPPADVAVRDGVGVRGGGRRRRDDSFQPPPDQAVVCAVVREAKTFPWESLSH
jgi:hypothetical protein